MKLVNKRKRSSPLSTKIFREVITALLENGELDIFLKTNKDDLIGYHHGLGTWIRNTFIYDCESEWHVGEDFMYDYPGEHADDVSFEMIMETHRLCHILFSEKKDLMKFIIEKV